MHAHGIVHRDIKPANVMLTRAGAKLLDFGLARRQRKAGAPGETARATTGLDAGVIAGTLPYMAPEQVHGQAIDARADIFALGAVLYEVLSGRRASRSPAASPGGCWHDASSDGRLLVHHGFERAGVKAKAPGDTDERDLGVFLFSWARDISADGSRVLVSDGDAPVQTYVRPTRGGPPVRLGEGTPLALSPAGAWALVASPHPHPQFILTPTGPGEPRTLPSGRFERIDSAWFVDEERLVIDASSGGQRSRGLLGDLSGGEPRAVTPEGVVSVRGSYRDGAVIGVAADGTLARYPLHGGDPQPMAARLPSGAIPLRVSGDGRFMFLGREHVAAPYRVDRLEFATGRIVPWKTLRPEDATGA